jgi:uncharacterized membrane protein YfcA
MTALALLVLLLVGLLVGVASGLVGIGGGVLIVPFLYFFYAHPGWSHAAIAPELHTIVAHATSLFVIVPTAIRGARSYNRVGLVVWKVALPIAVASGLATIVGTKLAEILPGGWLRIFFGAFLLFTGIQLVLRRHSSAPKALRLNVFAIVGTGVVVGLISGMLGIGGGAIASALMIQYIGLDLKQAAATSLAIIGISAIVGSITWVVRGWGMPGMPPGSLGYVHVLAAVPLLIGSVLTVRLGTVINQRMSERALKRVFAAFFTLLGLYLIGQNIDVLGL